MSQVQKRVLYLAQLDESAAEMADVEKRAAEAFALPFGSGVGRELAIEGDRETNTEDSGTIMRRRLIGRSPLGRRLSL